MWMLSLSKSGFLRALTCEVWFANAAETAASVATLTCLSLSARSCAKAAATALAVILSMSSAVSAIVNVGVDDVVEGCGGKSKVV